MRAASPDMVTAALHEHLKPGPCKTLFIFDEFRLSVGKLAIVNDFWALVRGYGVQFMPVCQSVTQLKKAVWWRMGKLRRAERCCCHHWGA